MKQPKLSFWQMWNVSFGFLGVQFGFALQNANVSRILSDLGADLHSLSLFWLAAPVMGLIVQPLVGGASDKTWTRLGRRGPFILAGALFAALGMFLMPNAPLFIKFISPMIFGGMMLALMDASFNVSFQPFRALVADMLPEEQRTKGYSIQSFLINVGAVIGSALPFILTNLIGLDNTSSKGNVAESVTWAFYIGASVLLGSVIWTVIRTKEYSPEEYSQIKGIDLQSDQSLNQVKPGIFERIKNFGVLVLEMPSTMKQLALVQFFSWFALYIMWVYTTPAIGQHIWGISPEYYNMSSSDIPVEIAVKMGQAGDWVGIIFAAYSLFAAIYSVLMSRIADKFGRKFTYAISLLLGGLGYLSFLVFKNPEMMHVNLLITEVDIPRGALNLILPMLGVGIAWAAILAMPYAILSNSIRADKMGVYMGIFNFTIAGPQIVSGLLGGFIISQIFDGSAIYMIALAGVSMLFGALAVFFVKE